MISNGVKSEVRRMEVDLSHIYVLLVLQRATPRDQACLRAGPGVPLQARTRTSLPSSISPVKRWYQE
jgi:hypothetical protein